MRAQSKTILASVSIAVFYVIASYVIREKVLLARQQKTGGYSDVREEEHLTLSQTTAFHTKSNTPISTATTTPAKTWCGRFHLITTYFIGIPTEFNSSHFKKVANFFGQQYRNFSQEQFSERNKEYVDTLQHNLNHPCVEKIHLFYVKEEDLKSLTDAHLKNFQKVKPVKHKLTLHMPDFFIYASRNLIGKPVVAVNGDIELENGFEKIDVQKMLEKKLLYSLSRYERKVGCQSAYRRDMCRKTYEGSHDCHIFALSEPLNESLLMEKIDFPINMFGSENGMIYGMRKFFNFTVTNPCYDVTVYHHHCSVVHGPLTMKYSIGSLGLRGIPKSSKFAEPTTL